MTSDSENVDQAIKDLQFIRRAFELSRASSVKPAEQSLQLNLTLHISLLVHSTRSINDKHYQRAQNFTRNSR